MLDAPILDAQIMSSTGPCTGTICRNECIHFAKRSHYKNRGCMVRLHVTKYSFNVLCGLEVHIPVCVEEQSQEVLVDLAQLYPCACIKRVAYLKMLTLLLISVMIL
jgi:hypothetical protein